MNIRLFSRLTPAGVHALLSLGQGKGLTPDQARDFLEDNSAMTSVAASGGSRDEELAWEIGREIRADACRCGFPDNISNVAKSKFDWDVAIRLASKAELKTGEALRDDVWSYMATVVLPDVVAWRFPGRTHERYAGGVRNTFQRLWVRGTTLDRGDGHADRWELVKGLSEDAAVQIFERPAIAGTKVLAIAVAETWLATASKIGRNLMEPVMRRATKLIRLRNEIIDIGGLPEEALMESVQACFDLALQPTAGIPLEQ